MAAETLCSSPALPTSSGDQRRCCFCDRDVMYGGSCQAPPTTTGALLQATAGTRWPSLWPSSCRASWSGCRSSRRSSTRRAWCRCVSGAGHRQGAAASSLLRRALLLCAWASRGLAGWLAGWMPRPASQQPVLWCAQVFHRMDSLMRTTDGFKELETLKRITAVNGGWLPPAGPPGPSLPAAAPCAASSELSDNSLLQPARFGAD